MGSKGHTNISITTTISPRDKGAKEDASGNDSGGESGAGNGSGGLANSPRGQLCLCSPTTHQGSFRTAYHHHILPLKTIITHIGSTMRPEVAGIPPSRLRY
ncbi:hypothetical protein E3N88_17683 [Mikania micrantha]|uniref:Uncharacterized protein n=1 Tax=Mikania micrantha TaxID=192012 RepID=A0A5N6NVK7_9ASTR|nr:hypothetical protein E3N88_17683 [Mikania micrantha]